MFPLAKSISKLYPVPAYLILFTPYSRFTICSSKLLQPKIIFIGAAKKTTLSPRCCALMSFRRDTVKSSASSHEASSNFPFLRIMGGGRPLGTVDELVSIPSFDAELTPVHGGSFQRHVSDQETVHNFEKHLAAAIGTGGCDKLIIHGRYKTPCQSSESEGHSLESTSASQQQTLSPSGGWFTIACCRSLCQMRHNPGYKTFFPMEGLSRPGHKKGSRS